MKVAAGNRNAFVSSNQAECWRNIVDVGCGEAVRKNVGGNGQQPIWIRDAHFAVEQIVLWRSDESNAFRAFEDDLGRPTREKRDTTIFLEIAPFDDDFGPSTRRTLQGQKLCNDG